MKKLLAWTSLVLSMEKAFASVGAGDGVIWSGAVGGYTFDGKQESGL